MADHDAALRQQALKTIRAGTPDERVIATDFLHGDLQKLTGRLQASADRAVEDMARSMFEGLDRALSRGDDAAEQNQRLPS